MEILSYIASLISTILGLFEPFGKKMRTVLIFSFTGSLMIGISYLLIAKYSGASICFVACVQVLINYTFDARGKKVPFLLVGVYAIVYLVMNLLTFRVWYDIFVLMAALLFVFGVAQSNAKYYRILCITNSIMWITYDLLAGAYGNLFSHIVYFASIALAIVFRDTGVLRRRVRCTEKA